MNALAAEIKETIKTKGVTQEVIAQELRRHRTWVSRFLSDDTLNDAETLRKIADTLDCSWLYKLAHETLCGLVFVHRKLDGETVDLHRSSVKTKLIEELNEAIVAIKGVDLVNRPQKPLTDDEKRRVLEEELFPVLGAECSIETYIAVRCEELGISPAEAYELWHKRLESKGYTQREGRKS